RFGLALAEELGCRPDAAEIAATEDDAGDLDVGPAEATALHCAILRAAVSQMPAQCTKARVPFCAHACDPVHRVAQRLGCQLVSRLASFTATLDEARLVQRGEMLCHSLPRHRQLGRELGRR